MIFYFTVSSVYSFGKTFLYRRKWENGNFLLKDRPLPVYQQPTDSFLWFYIFCPASSVKKSENLLVSVILSANDFSHGWAAEFVRNCFKPSFRVKWFLSFLCDQLYTGTSSHRRFSFHIFDEHLKDSAADSHPLNIRLHHKIHNHEVHSVADQSPPFQPSDCLFPQLPYIECL